MTHRRNPSFCHSCFSSLYKLQIIKGSLHAGNYGCCGCTTLNNHVLNICWLCRNVSQDLNYQLSNSDSTYNLLLFTGYGALMTFLFNGNIHHTNLPPWSLKESQLVHYWSTWACFAKARCKGKVWICIISSAYSNPEWKWKQLNALERNRICLAEKVYSMPQQEKLQWTQ